MHGDKLVGKAPGQTRTSSPEASAASIPPNRLISPSPLRAHDATIRRCGSDCCHSSRWRRWFRNCRGCTLFPSWWWRLSLSLLPLPYAMSPPVVMRSSPPAVVETTTSHIQARTRAKASSLQGRDCISSKEGGVPPLSSSECNSTLRNSNKRRRCVVASSS